MFSIGLGFRHLPLRCYTHVAISWFIWPQCPIHKLLCAHRLGQNSNVCSGLLSKLIYFFVPTLLRVFYIFFSISQTNVISKPWYHCVPIQKYFTYDYDLYCIRRIKGVFRNSPASRNSVDSASCCHSTIPREAVNVRRAASSFCRAAPMFLFLFCTGRIPQSP
jgi:hypothetical protein